ncbi:MAG: TlpA family protein disulfide reductase [Armatimonadota bacterium]
MEELAQVIPRASLVLLFALTAVAVAPAQQQADRQPLRPGAEAPEFIATTLESVPLRLEQWQGKVVVLNFFITWYRDAADHLDMMEDLQDTYAREGMRLLSISLDEGERGVEQVRKLVREEELAHPVVVDSEQSIAGPYGVRALPAIFVIGRDGKIAYYHEGYTEGDERRLSKAIAGALGVECATAEADEDEASETEAEQTEEPVCDCFRREEE